MNILLINHYAGSPSYGMAYRPYYFAKAWNAKGNRVRIVASSYSHLRVKQPLINGRSKVTHDGTDGIEYVWVKTPKYKGNGARRFINIISFVFSLLFYRKKILKGFVPDVVIASSTYPLDIYPAYLIAKLNKAKLVFEVHDLWPLSPIEIGGVSRWNPFIILLQFAENFAYRKADYIVSMLSNAKEYMQEHGMKSDKFNYIPNGVNKDDRSVGKNGMSDNIRKEIDKIKNKKHFLLTYTGYHGTANALDYVIDAMVILKDKKVSLLMVGDGPEKKRLYGNVVRLNLENVVFVGLVDKYAIPSILEASDALFIGWRRNPIYRFGICPNKLMDYMMAGKPVLHSVEAGNDIVKESGCGISVKPEDPQAIADAITDLMSKTEEERTLMGEKGKLCVLKNYTYDILAKKFLQVIEKKDSFI